MILVQLGARILIGCLMTSVEGSLSFRPNRCVRIASFNTYMGMVRPHREVFLFPVSVFP